MYPIILLLTIVLIGFSTQLQATDQVPEVFFDEKRGTFYYNGRDLGNTYPLYGLAKYKTYREKINMDSTGQIRSSCYSTACYRGYRGTWTIKDSTLFLSELEAGCSSYNDIPNIEEVFRAEWTKHGLKAFWVTDTITLTDEPFNVSTITRTFSYLTLVIHQGRIIKITEKGPYFAPKPEYIKDKYNLASNQLPELLTYNNQQFYAKGDWDPLSSIFADENYLNRLDTTEYGAVQFSSCFSEDCLRSYQGIWTIINDTLYLKEVKDFCTAVPLFELEKIFGPENVTSKGVRAFWLSQVLVVSSKEFSEFELKDARAPNTYLKLKIVKGVVVRKELEAY